MFKASLGNFPSLPKATHREVATQGKEPPLAGLPETFHGKALAWTWPGHLDPWRCVSCGRPQAEYLGRRDVEAVLCGRCFMILADDSPEVEDPLTPEERALVTQRKRRREAKERGR